MNELLIDQPNIDQLRLMIIVPARLEKGWLVIGAI